MCEVAMRYFLILMFLIGNVYAATCTSLSRTNYTANQILTSTALNADLNGLLTNSGTTHGLNNFDGGCVIDASLEKGALNTTDFAYPLNYGKDGCSLSYTNAAQLTISDCGMSINGSWVRTTTGTLVGWTSYTGSEAASTTYYVYAANGSTGSTLTPKITITAPDDDGYSGSDKALGYFYNNYSSDIEPNSITTWSGESFIPKKSARVYGSVKWAVTTNCTWPEAQGTSWSTVAADGDCDDNARTCYGRTLSSHCGAGESDGQYPRIEFASLEAGYYQVVMHGALYPSTAAQECGMRWTDGTTTSGFLFAGPTGGAATSNLIGSFYYATAQGAKTFYLQMYESGSGSCNLTTNADPFYTREIVVYYYPMN